MSRGPVIHAPELPTGLTWLNAPRAIALRELRGHVVILDFWTYCCINCMHVIPVLRRIEEEYASSPVVVLGVHSAKFDAEKDAARVLEAMRRYDVAHPVVVDRDMQVWEAFAVRSWPTLVVVRPDGTIAAVAPGEPDPAALERLIGDELAAAQRRGQLAPSPFAFRAAGHAESGALRYPGKIAVSAKGKIAIADSGHNRVLVVDPGGRVLSAIGSGRAGYGNGAFEEAAFDDPQGLAWSGENELFVADARTHTVRGIDLTRREVREIAGTGVLGEAPLDRRRGATACALRSPWDLALDGRRLYVALAGSHQIALVNLDARTIEPVAGNGVESIDDGPFEVATFSQPSGLALDARSRMLYVADSETSSVRVLDLDRRTVRTLVGHGLFDFGDRDGPCDTARLQHDLGVALSPQGALVVADTYNHKLKTVDRESGATTTFFAGDLAEPSALAWANGEWLVCDTNHHRIARVGERGEARGAIAISGAPSPKSGRIEGDGGSTGVLDSSWFTTRLAARGTLGPGEAALLLAIPAPAGKKFAPGTPVTLTIEVSRRSDLLVLKASQLRLTAEEARAARLALTVRPFEEEKIDAELVLRIDGVT
jgi:DNA-binding beta-propeller fold protein YncE